MHTNINNGEREMKKLEETIAVLCVFAALLLGLNTSLNLDRFCMQNYNQSECTSMNLLFQDSIGDVIQEFLESQSEVDVLKETLKKYVLPSGVPIEIYYDYSYFTTLITIRRVYIKTLQTTDRGVHERTS